MSEDTWMFLSEENENNLMNTPGGWLQPVLEGYRALEEAYQSKSNALNKVKAVLENWNPEESNDVHLKEQLMNCVKQASLNLGESLAACAESAKYDPLPVVPDLSVFQSVGAPTQEEYSAISNLSDFDFVHLVRRMAKSEDEVERLIECLPGGPKCPELAPEILAENDRNFDEAIRLLRFMDYEAQYHYPEVFNFLKKVDGYE